MAADREALAQEERDRRESAAAEEALDFGEEPGGGPAAPGAPAGVPPGAHVAMTAREVKDLLAVTARSALDIDGESWCLTPARLVEFSAYVTLQAGVLAAGVRTPLRKPELGTCIGTVSDASPLGLPGDWPLAIGHSHMHACWPFACTVAIGHWPLAIGHSHMRTCWPLAIGHWPFWPLAIGHRPLVAGGRHPLTVRRPALTVPRARTLQASLTHYLLVPEGAVDPNRHATVASALEEMNKALAAGGITVFGTGSGPAEGVAAAKSTVPSVNLRAAAASASPAPWLPPSTVGHWPLAIGHRPFVPAAPDSP